MSIDLSRYDNSWYSPGGRVRRGAWFFVNSLLVNVGWMSSSRLRCFLLRLFGASVGLGVVIRPNVNIKYPWNLTIGDNAWIGEGTWLDSLSKITIGSNVCISQGSYLCTGNHDIRSETFDLMLGDIVLEDESWVGARACVAPGVTLGYQSVLTMGSVLTQDAEPRYVYQGNPAKRVRERFKL